MNAPRTMPTLHTLHLIGLTLCLLIANATNPVFAQTTEPSVAVSTTTTVPNEVDSVGYMPPVPFVGRIDIGGATNSLLSLQRASQSPHPRPIDGEQASRSYQRYLKSFETTIPEHYESGLNLKKQ